ncbi:MAG: sigma-54-dependent transcriptional regulator, partial [bacterium]
MKENLQYEAITHPCQPIFVIDDEIDSLINIEALLRFKGINNITVCQDSSQAIPLLLKREPSIVLLDLIMPNLRGEDLLKEIVEDFPEIPVIVITGLNDVKTAVECMKMGAYDYLTKPIDENLFFSVIQKTIDNLKLKWEIRRLKEQVLNRNLENTEAFSSIITKNNNMLSIFQYIEAIGKGSEPVLITGESGVGKELIAKEIHLHSPRASGPFEVCDCTALPPNLAESELFGHVRGAFTGA